MIRKLKQVAVAVLALGATSAALALPSVTTAFTPGAQNTLSDDFVEFLQDNDASGTLTVGDVLVTSLGITSYAPSGVPANTVNELSVVAAIEISSVVALPDAACSAGFVSPAGGCAAFTFVPPSVGLAAILAAAGVPAPSLPLTADSVAVFMEDTTPDFTTSDASTAFDGTTRLVIDLTAANGDFWGAVGPTAISDFLANPVGVGIGSFSMDLTISSQAFAGWNLGPDFTGRGTLSRAPADSESPVGGDASFFTDMQRIPEPASLALVGLALLGLGAGARRRQQ